MQRKKLPHGLDDPSDGLQDPPPPPPRLKELTGMLSDCALTQ